MLVVDGLFTVIWLSAFSTQAAYNSTGDCGKACDVSKGVVGLAVFVTYENPLPPKARPWNETPPH